MGRNSSTVKSNYHQSAPLLIALLTQVQEANEMKYRVGNERVLDGPKCAKLIEPQRKMFPALEYE